MNDLPSEQKDERFIEPSRIDPETDKTRAGVGIKLFVLFFFLLVPALGVVLVVAVGWRFWRFFMAG